MTEIAPNSRGKPSCLDIKAAWEAKAPGAGARTVAAAMRTEGFAISDRTVGRTAARGFGPSKKDRTPKPPKPPKDEPPPQERQTSPEINAANQVKAFASPDTPPELTGAAIVEAYRNLPEGAKDRVKALLDMDEADIIASTRKLYLIAGHLLAEDLAQHTKLMMLAPDKAAKLWLALGSGLMTGTTPPLPAGHVTVLDHDANEPRRLSPSAQAIEDFRAKRRSAAA